MKKIVSLKILTCAYVLIEPFSLITNTSVMDQNPVPLPVFSVQNAETDEEIALSLLDQYLDHYTKHGLYDRLLAYKCDSVQIDYPQDPGCLFCPFFRTAIIRPAVARRKRYRGRQMD